MVGQHRKPKSPWLRRIITVVLLTGAYFAGSSLGGHHGVDPKPQAEATGQSVYSSVAQKFALSVHDQLCGRPSLPQLLCAQATEVAANPIHDGKDGKPGVDGVDGAAGRNGRDGQNGSPAREEIFQFPNSIYVCPRAGGSDAAPIFKCALLKSSAPAN